MTSERENARVPCGENVARLQYILNTSITVHQRLSILLSTGTCVSGLFPLFFPSNTMQRAPILYELGAVGPDAYKVLRKAATEEKIQLPKSLIVRLGD